MKNTILTDEKINEMFNRYSYKTEVWSDRYQQMVKIGNSVIDDNSFETLAREIERMISEQKDVKIELWKRRANDEWEKHDATKHNYDVKCLEIESLQQKIAEQNEEIEQLKIQLSLHETMKAQIIEDGKIIAEKDAEIAYMNEVFSSIEDRSIDGDMQIIRLREAIEGWEMLVRQKDLEMKQLKTNRNADIAKAIEQERERYKTILNEELSRIENQEPADSFSGGVQQRAWYYQTSNIIRLLSV